MLNAYWSRKFGVSFAAAIATGLVWGILLRVVMKIIALAHPELSSGFHWEATMFIALVGVGFILANSVIFTLVERLLPAGRLAKGSVYGLLNLVVYGIPFFLSNPGGELFGPQAYVGVPLFSLLFVGGGIALAGCVRFIDDWVEARREKRLRFTYASFICLCIPAGAILFGVVSEIVTDVIPEIRNSVGDRIVFMEQGRILEVAPPKELFFFS